MAQLVVFARHAPGPGFHQALVNQAIPASNGSRQGGKKTERGRFEKVKVPVVTVRSLEIFADADCEQNLKA